MSIFRAAIERKAEEAISLNPAIQTGYLLNTSDVVDATLKNPYFYSLNNMSILDGMKLKQDSIKSGFSVGVKDVNGVSRTERIFCNPKFTDPQIMGDANGKRSSIPIDQCQIILADMCFSGTNNQSPTILGVQALIKKVPDLTTISSKDVAENSSTPTTINLGSLGGLSGSIGGSLGIQEGSAHPKLLDKSGKEIKGKDKSQRGVYGNSIRTGTTKVSSSELSQLVNNIGSYF